MSACLTEVLLADLGGGGASEVVRAETLAQSAPALVSPMKANDRAAGRGEEEHDP
jgi:hypothetical protein